MSACRERGEFSCDARLRLILAGSEELVRSRLQSCADVDAFVLELRDIVERIKRSEAPSSAASALERPTPTASIACVLSEVEALGWARVASVDTTLRRIELRANDEAGRPHSLAVSLPLDYPASAPTCSVSLPGDCTFSSAAATNAAASGGKRKRGADSSATRGALVALVRAFEARLATHQDLWDVLDDIDAHYLVIQPAHPTRGESYRRVAIGRHCSMHLKLDPADPCAPCDVTFLGGESVVGPLRRRLRIALDAGAWVRPARGAARGVRAETLRRNLAAILKTTFPGPSKAAAQSDDVSVECGICYAYQLHPASATGAAATAATAATAAEEAAAACVPDFACQNARCGRPFHRACLQLWLQALPSTRRSFDTMFGKCPYCSSALSLSAVPQ